MRIARVGQFNERFLPNLLEIQLASYDDFLGRRFNIFWSLVGETETLHNFLYTLAKNYTLGIRVSKGTTKERAETANRILAEVRDRINPDAIKDEIPRPNYYYIILPKGKYTHKDIEALLEIANENNANVGVIGISTKTKDELINESNLRGLVYSVENSFFDHSEPRSSMSLKRIFEEIFPLQSTDGRVDIEYLDYRVGDPDISPEDAKKRDLTYSVPIHIRTSERFFDENGKIEREILDVVYFMDVPYMTSRGTFVIKGVERVVINQIHRSPGVYFLIEEEGLNQIFSSMIIPYRGPWMELRIEGEKGMYFLLRKKKFYLTRFLRFLGFSEFRDIIKVAVGHIAQEKFLSEAEGYYLAEDITNEDGEVIIPMVDDKGQITVIDGSITEKLKRRKIHRVKVFDPKDPAVNIVLKTLREDKIRRREEAIRYIYRVIRFSSATVENAEDFLRDYFFSPDKTFIGKVGRYKINTRLYKSENIEKYLKDLEGFSPPKDDIENLTETDFVVALRMLMDLYRGEVEEDDIDDLAHRRIKRVGEQLFEWTRNELIKTAKGIREKLISEREPLRNIVHPKIVSRSIINFFTQNSLSQLLDQTNPLSELTIKRRISAMGKGGLTKETATLEVRDVHPSHYGRICPIETPEGQNIGLILSPTVYARINELGFIETPVVKVEKGKVTNEVNYLTPQEDINLKIAPADIEIDPKTKRIKQSSNIIVRHKRSYMFANREEIDYMDLSPRQIISPSTSLIPFLEYDDANRALMGSNMQRQAVPLLNPESPNVGTGMEAKIAEDSGSVILAQEDGEVVYVDYSKIMVRPEGSMFNVKTYNLRVFERSGQNTIVHYVPKVKKGQKVKKGDILAENLASVGGEISIGRNLTVAFMPWYGYNFEDAIVISDRLVKEDKLTSIHILEFAAEVNETRLGPEVVTREPYKESERNIAHLDEYGIARIGSKVGPGDILVGKNTPREEKKFSELSPEEKLLMAIFGEKSKPWKNTSLRVPPAVHGTVIGVEILTRYIPDDPIAHGYIGPGGEFVPGELYVDHEVKPDMPIPEKRVIGKRQRKLLEEINLKIQNLRDSLREILQVRLSGVKVEKPIFAGKNKILDKGDIITGEILRSVDPLELRIESGALGDKNLEEDLRRIISDGREAYENLLREYEEGLERIRRGDELPAGVRQVIKVYIAQKRKIKVGDKLAGRHGNKGVISIIAPEADMPFMEDGTPVDIVLNPLGVPSRMNVGQILETLLGYAAVKNTEKLREMLDKGESPSKIREFLIKLYEPHKDEEFKGWLKEAEEEDILHFAQELAKRGVKYACPAFQSLKVEEVKEQLKLAGLPEDGKMRLRDGRTGEYLDFPVTVGNMYIMKLIHMVEDKIHARSTGPYSLITQQPVGGRSHMGGQRFGEMEVWALEAHGAAYALWEMLTIKSDDVKGRLRLYKALREGTEPPLPSTPSTFNVLSSFLRALAINLEIKRG
ncbi:MAG: DNA-directed RNA polymerase subunit beta [Candidatus Caldipriscus sp.]|nr:DNA-directed RNA polymerase subunit beta [Candidatus Caldipriscus sp.]